MLDRKLKNGTFINIICTFFRLLKKSHNMKHVLYYLLAYLTSTTLVAQTAQITLKTPVGSNFMLSLATEQVRHHEAPSIGLTDMEFLNIGYFDDTTKQWAMTEFELKEPQIVRLNISSKAQAFVANQRPQQRSNYVLFISPNDKLTITINADKSLTFEGTNAIYQEVLRDYFRDNLYEYLPIFGYNPTKIDNSAILPKVDSLQQARQQRLQTLKSQQPINEAFETYLTATTNTEAYLMKLIVADKKIRESQGVQLRPEQRREIENLTLQNFKILPDAALMSEPYRRELRNYIQIPVTQKYPTDSAKRFVLSGEAVQFAYQLSDEKLRAYPRQREYLLTHWLDYSTTFRSDMAAAQSLVENYEKTYPASELIPYFKRTIAAKKGMYVGQPAPNFSFKNEEGKEVSLSSLKGKPVCIAFCFNLKQHELIFKPLEEAYRDRLTFAYLNVTPNTPFEDWKSMVQTRPGVVHLWTSDEDAQKLRDMYATTMRYPFVLIDSQGKIVERWIPQEFPDNKTLQEELRGLIRK